jgi:transcriptional regulator NrdR family protein
MLPMENLKVGDRVSYLRYEAKINSVIKQIKTVSDFGKPLPSAIACLENGTVIPLEKLSK